jgi:predicted enzyme related to lactoylglutathione lyase
MTKRNIVHIEIPTRNFEESGEFYNKLFGWKIMPMPEMNYSMWEPDEGPGGGFNPLGDGVQIDNVLIYVNSDDIAADLKNAKSLGATILKVNLKFRVLVGMEFSRILPVTQLHYILR